MLARLAGGSSASLVSLAQGHSSKSEIEVADFDRLFSRLERVEMAHTAMRELLVAIKES